MLVHWDSLLCCVGYCDFGFVMEGLKQPAELSFEGNISENWRRFRRNFENYLVAINLVLVEKATAEAPEPAANAGISKRQIAMLLHIAGEEANEVFAQLEFAADKSKEKLADVLDVFEAYCNPRKNELYEWFVFWSMTQSPGEPIDTYLKRLKTQASRCEFANEIKSKMLLCRVVFGISSVKLKERLLRDNTMTLEKAVNELRAAEMTHNQLNLIAEGDKASAKHVAAVEKRTERAPSVGASSGIDQRKLSCKYCPYEHVKGKCPAYGKVCRKCNRKNHFSSKCLSKGIQSIENDGDDLDQNVNTLFIGAVGTDGLTTSKRQSWLVELKLGERSSGVTSFKVDTGAETNTITEAIATELKAVRRPSKVRLLGYNGTVIKNHGHVIVPVWHGTANAELRFEIVSNDLTPILGLEASERLGVVRRMHVVSSADILDEFPDVFQGLGCLEGDHEISVDTSVKPVIHSPRRVPISMMAKVKAELDRMEAAGVVSRVDKPTKWVSSMVCVEKKNGDVRICLDPRDLNKAVLREHHRIPTMEDIAFKFNGMKFFTIVDMKHGYWHVPLTQSSSLLTTFNTPFGRYCYNRLPFGLRSSAEVFEKRVEQVFGDLPVSIYFDDLIVAGETQEAHDENLRRLLERARTCNVKFNRDKIQLNRTEVSYLGHIVSAEGLKADPTKVKAIADMPSPTDVAGIQRLLGTLNFLRSYIPDMSNLTQPFRCLMKQDTLWSWGPDQEEALNLIKKVLCSDQVLRYFDISKEVNLQVDASKGGLGAVLLQEGQPVAYASRALTETECNYPQIDKELLAIVFGCEYFHSYLYGRAIAIQTDHKPLLSIIKKPLQKASPRLQRLLLRLQRYELGSVTYVPGKLLYIADTLSRAYLTDSLSAQDELENEVVMVHTLEVSENMHGWLAAAYAEDTTMAELAQAVSGGWHWSHKSQVPANLQPYWNIRDELYEAGGLLYIGERLVIPAPARRRILDMLHDGHLGTNKCRERARRTVYWPGLNNDIMVRVSSCSNCAMFANKQTREPLISHEVPKLPWYTVAMDILEFNGDNFLVVVDCMSHFPELRLIKRKTTVDVVMALKSIFSIHGIPMSILADNMPFGSHAMAEFANDWNFTVVTSSPHHHQSNGMAERYVQTIKQFMKKCEASGNDIYRSLLVYRETPLTGCMYSPAEMLFNRCIRSGLPVTTETLRPLTVDAGDILKERQDVAKLYHDKGKRALPELKPGTSVLTRTDEQKRWQPGHIVDHHPAPRSYLVDNGRSIIRRNRVHLKPNPTGLTTQVDNENGSDAAFGESQAQTEASGAHAEVRSSGGQSRNLTLAAPVTDAVLPGPTSSELVPQRSRRVNRGVLPARFKDYQMD